MEKLEIQCEIITPLLLHGANKQNAELRAPSIKGAMRFWWRAIHGNLPLDELREQEAEIFGDTERKSGFGIRVLNSNLEIDSFNPLPHKKDNFKIKGFQTNQTFEIEFFGKNIETVKNIFILSTILGGFGQRARRGFGSIQIVGNEVLTSLNKVESFINNVPTFENSQTNYPYIKDIEIGKTEETDFNKVLKKIGEATHNYPYFGSANPRFASPVYISIIRIENKYYPIITTLKSTKYIKQFNQLKDFKKAIL